MKKFLLGIITIIGTLFFTVNVYAASATIAVTSSSNQVIVGKEVTVYVTISSGVALGAWEYTLNYDKSIWQLVRSDKELHYADAADNDSTKSVSYKYIFKALKSGNSNFYIDSSAVADMANGEFMDVKDGSKKIKTLTYSEYQASLSSNNNLKSLAVDGYEITPEFDKETLEYTVKVNEDETSIKILATAEDKTATINGAGEVEVSAGNNVFDILVIAQNGSEKTYKLNVEVIDKDPINVKVDNIEYTVVKLASNLIKPESYIETTVIINEYEIPAFYSEVTEFTLVGLKDREGNISLFIYRDDKYTKYNELNFGNITIYPQKMQVQINDYEKSTMNLQDAEVEVLSLTRNSRYKLIYGLNVETKEEGLYLYDTKDNTLIKYDQEYIKILENKNKMLMYSTIAFIGSTILALFGIIGLSKKKKYNKKNKELKDIHEQEKNKLENSSKVDVKDKKIKTKNEAKSDDTILENPNEIIEKSNDEIYDIFEDEHRKRNRRRNSK